MTQCHKNDGSQRQMGGKLKKDRSVSVRSRAVRICQNELQYSPLEIVQVCWPLIQITLLDLVLFMMFLISHMVSIRLRFGY